MNGGRLVETNDDLLNARSHASLPRALLWISLVPPQASSSVPLLLISSLALTSFEPTACPPHAVLFPPLALQVVLTATHVAKVRVTVGAESNYPAFFSIIPQSVPNAS